MPINYGRRVPAHDTKTASYKTYDSKTDKVATTGELNDGALESFVQLQEDPRQLYRGLISGIAFMTSKGYRGSRLDSLWSKFVYDSFVHDDTELCDIGMQSCLADVHSIVSGGENGCPFYIGNFSFHVAQQFEYQAHLLKDLERENIRKGEFLTPSEWSRIDEKLDSISQYGHAKVHHVIRGDSFLALAIRKSAYNVSIHLLNRELDPILENEDQEDIVHILIKQASMLVLDLKDIDAKRSKAAKEVVLPSVMKAIIYKEKETVAKMISMAEFVVSVIPKLHEKLIEIESLKRLKRLADLKREVLPYESRLLLSQEGKIIEHINFLTELKPYLEKKVEHHQEKVSKYDNFGDKVRKMSLMSQASFRTQRSSISDPDFIREQILKAVTTHNTEQSTFLLENGGFEDEDKDDNISELNDIASNVDKRRQSRKSSRVSQLSAFSIEDGKLTARSAVSDAFSQCTSTSSSNAETDNTRTTSSNLFRVPEPKGHRARKSKYAEPLGEMPIIHTGKSICLILIIREWRRVLGFTCHRQKPPTYCCQLLEYDMDFEHQNNLEYVLAFNNHNYSTNIFVFEVKLTCSMSIANVGNPCDALRRYMQDAFKGKSISSARQQFSVQYIFLLEARGVQKDEV
eukprot:gene7657-15669_t